MTHDHPDPQNNPHTGRSRSSTLSGSFGPIQPNPSTGGQQKHERRGSFMASLFGVAAPFTNSIATATGNNANAEPNPAPQSTSSSNSTGWSPASSVVESVETGTTSATSAMPTDIPGGDVTPKDLSASVGALGSWGRAATWMQDRDREASSTSDGIVAGTGMQGRRLSVGPTFRRPFEFPTYTSNVTSSPPPSPEAKFSTLSRVTSAPSAPDHPDGGVHESRGRLGAGIWGKKEKTKRKLSPMGERMIRDSMFH